MTQLLTAVQMRGIEIAAIESGAVSGLKLMERAGRGVVDAVMTQWPDLAQGAHRAVVLCGPGNNGGDGFVVARLLNDVGWKVDVIFAGDPEKLPPDAKTMYESWCKNNAVTSYESTQQPLFNPEVALIVDALFGTGLTRPIEGMDGLFQDVQAARKLGTVRVVSVDVPSGLCSDSGRLLGAEGDTSHIEADLTVTFHSLKVGHVLASGSEVCGQIVLCDIGLDRRNAQRVLDACDVSETVVTGLCLDITKGLAKTSCAHKFDYGHALVLSGGPGQTGAARLAARGALRIGAGVVTLGVPPAAQLEVATHVTAIMLKRIADGDALARVLDDQRLNALCVGPALGLGDDKAVLVKTALECKRAIVLDGDALTLIAHSTELFDLLHADCVLTPHAGEFARLFPDIAENLNATATHGPAYSKVDATCAAAERARCVVLFKGADTVIASSASSGGRCSINSGVNDSPTPWLATAGSGDVLAGFITGLLARGFEPHHAAETGAYLHKACALRFGAGLIAEDLPEELPKVFQALGV